MSGPVHSASRDERVEGTVLDTVTWVLPYKILLGAAGVLVLGIFSLPVVLLMIGMLGDGSADSRSLVALILTLAWAAIGVVLALFLIRAIRLCMTITTEGVQVRPYGRRRWYAWADIALVRSREGWLHLGATELVLVDGRTITVWFTAARYALQRGDRRDPAVWSAGWGQVPPLRPTRSAIDAHRQWLHRRGTAAPMQTDA